MVIRYQASTPVNGHSTTTYPIAHSNADTVDAPIPAKVELLIIGGGQTGKLSYVYTI